jgi:anti-sigma regulatory factor (Ser/Thr protein kinase)
VTHEYQLTPEPAAVAKARRFVRATLAGRIDDEQLADAELIVSELVTNSVRHGPGRPITLRLGTQADGGVIGEIEDQGDGVVAIREQDVGTTIGGLGLPIVDQIASEWGVYEGSTHVWFRLDP